jgi:hypothetical protein
MSGSTITIARGISVIVLVNICSRHDPVKTELLTFELKRAEREIL